MDDVDYYRFNTPTMELVIDEFDNTTEEDCDTLSLPSLPSSLQMKLASTCKATSCSQRNQAMSMKEIDEKLNALRRENFDLKLRLFCESQNKGFHHRTGDRKYFNSSSSQTDNGCGIRKPVASINRSCQTIDHHFIYSDNGVQTDNIEEEAKYTDSSKVNQFSSISVQTEQSSIGKDYQHEARKIFKDDVDSLLVNQSFHDSNHCQFDLKSLCSSSPPFTQNQHSLTNSGSKSDLNSKFKRFSSSLSSLLTPQPDVRSKSVVKIINDSDCDYLSEIRPKNISKSTSSPKVTNYRNLVDRECKKTCFDTKTVLNESCYSFYARMVDESITKLDTDYKKQNIIPANQQTEEKLIDKMYTLVNRQVDDHTLIDNNRQDVFNSRKKVLFHEDANNIRKVYFDDKLLDDKGRSNLTIEEGENCHFSSSDLGLGDSDQEMNGDLIAYISLGNYQFLRGNLNQLSSHLDYLDNLFRDCFILQSISLSEYSAHLKPSLSNLHSIINLIRRICKQFKVEDGNTISDRLDKIKAKKESLEKAITRQLKRTDKLLRKAKLNLKTC